MARTPRSRDLSRFGAFMVRRHIGTVNLAHRAGVSGSYVSLLKYGRCEPTLRMMRRMADAVRGMVGRRVPFNELFDLGDGE